MGSGSTDRPTGPAAGEAALRSGCALPSTGGEHGKNRSLTMAGHGEYRPVSRALGILHRQFSAQATGRIADARIEEVGGTPRDCRQICKIPDEQATRPGSVDRKNSDMIRMDAGE